MTAAAATRAGPALVRDGLARRTAANERFFAAESERLARLCHQMAERFARSGRLIALASAAPARSDARHVAVEFAHPVIVGKRALPAFALTGPAGELTPQANALAGADDIVMAFGDDQPASAVHAARAAGALTVGFGAQGAEWEFHPPARDPYVAQELVETLYHVLWELVHVFFEHRGLLGGRHERRHHDSGASAFLYPFLAESEHDLDAVLADVAASVRMKADEVARLREQTLSEGADTLLAAAETARSRLARGGMVLALGNGGSATDAMDLVADLRATATGAPRPALDLAEDPAIITAIANDIGTEAIFARQVIAYGRPDDVLVAISTSGNSGNVLAALEQARRRGLATIALVGYDGGRIAAEGLADHVIITRSEHIPRIQEAQASAYHTLLAALA